MTTLVILAAGLGSRLGNYTVNLPKPLIQVNGIPIIDNIITNSIELGVDKILIVVGYLSTKLIEYVKKQNYNIDIEFILNKDYLTTNNSFSLLLAMKKIVDSDLLIIEGDVFFDKGFFKRNFKNNNHWFVDSEIKNIDGCYITHENNKVINIEILRDYSLVSDLKYKSTGILFFTYDNVKKLSKLIETNSNYWKSYYDVVISENLFMFEIFILDVKDSVWFEIDDEDDLHTANNYFK